MNSRPIRQVGLDFDNTIVCYDQLFLRLVREKGLLPDDTVASKRAIRNQLRERGNESAWTLLQGEAYGPRIIDAPPFDGVCKFLRRATESGIPVAIVSHKTAHPYAGPPYDLRGAARRWLEFHGLFEAGLERDAVYFEPTPTAKMKRIAVLDPDVFIDDLPEFLTSPRFPSTVTPVLFDPNEESTNISLAAVSSWRALGEALFEPTNGDGMEVRSAAATKRGHSA